MSTWMWILFAVTLTAELPIFLAWAPMSWWRRMDQRNVKLACFLWGYSHPIGPRLRAGEIKPWYREMVE